MSRLFATAFFCFLAVLIGVGGSAPARAAEPNQRQAVDFARDVYPVLRRTCFECHGQKKQEGDLRLDERADALGSGVIEPGEPADSELLRRILLPRNDDEVMPAIGEPLPKRQIAIIRRWIEQGAKWPETFEAQQHWAYVVPQRPTSLPMSNAEWVKSPIDQFVLNRLEAAGLTPSPQARPEKLVRRVFLDLIGLPPAPEEINTYLSNRSEDRFEQLVDDLLQRPQFGERWARPWLDLARYADSHGFQRDNLRDIWAYRDWVIRALNDDMPFDQFTIEQIAGDLLPRATESQGIATGFHRCTPTNVEAGSLPEKTRIEQVIDRVNTTGAVWLGTTLECCQCHDHKYDPFTQKDYYRLLAFYNNTEMEADRASKSPSSIKFNGPSMPLKNPARDARRGELQKQQAAIKHQQATQRKKLASSLETWISELSRDLAELPQTHSLDVVGFESEGTTDSFKKLEDASILLVGGDPPGTDAYTVRVRTQLAGIRGFRLEALRHDSLPGKGPGRGDPIRRNFVLNEFSVQLRHIGCVAVEDKAETAGDASVTQLTFSGANASFSQTNWDVAGAIDDNPKTGWAIAPQFDRSHSATFILSEPLDVPEDCELVFTLRHKYGQARAIGCFRLSAITGNINAESVPAEIVKAAAKPIMKWTKQDRKKLLDYRVKQDGATSRLTRELAKVAKQINQVAADTTLVMIELDEPRVSTQFKRGDYRQPGEVVTPGTPGILHSLQPGPPNRLTLARWLVSQENPLVARVTVNRWWADLFGQGLVSTVEDFGIKGELPTHPELLDWLAVEFMENGWSMKQLMKTIVLSATYQQSSRTSRERRQSDDLNLLLARGPRFRMEAEMIRDNALSISGLLSLKQFGPSIRPYQPAGIWKKVGGTAYNYEVSPGSEQHRRGIYVVLKRGGPYPSFSNFDATARLACTVKRSRTNTPLQALTLLNDPVYVEAIRALAKRVVKEKADAPLDAQLDYAFQLCTARQPTDNQRDTLRNLFHQQVEATAKRTPESTAAAARADAWFCVATVLLNMHETITKD
jgi:mono/diheme cytochrome c family protein